MGTKPFKNSSNVLKRKCKQVGGLNIKVKDKQLEVQVFTEGMMMQCKIKNANQRDHNSQNTSRKCLNLIVQNSCDQGAEGVSTNIKLTDRDYY